MTTAIRKLLLDPKVAGVAVDDPSLLERHQQVLAEKPLLASAFEAFYRQMLALRDRHVRAQGIEVELGSGAGFFKRVHPELITSDIRPGRGIDRVVDALDMPFEARSVRCLYAINLFHHLPDPGVFFNEVSRVLAPGGLCMLVEPHGGFFSAFLHRRLHADEYFDETATWRNEGITGPLGGANQAAAEIVFRRDRPIFDTRFGNQLEIVERPYALNALRYLASGGVNFRPLLPAVAAPLLSAVEHLASPLARHWSLHQVTVIRRRAQDLSRAPR